MQLNTVHLRNVLTLSFFIQVKSWLDIVKENLVTDQTEIKFRCAYIIKNMMAADKEIASKVYVYH